MATQTAFQKAVEATEGLKRAWQPGKQALKENHSKFIGVANDEQLAGSVDIDEALSKAMPNDPRWDYGVGYRPSKHRSEWVYWIEVHPATEGDVALILNKLKWLLDWLSASAPQWNAFQREFVWVSSNKTSFTQSSPQGKILATKGVRLAGRYFEIPAVAPEK